MIMAIRCGHTGLNAMARFAQSHRQEWLKCLPLPRSKTPSSSSLPRVSRAIDFEPICNAFNEWMKPYYQPEDLAIDGKSINSTMTSGHDSQPNFVS